MKAKKNVKTQTVNQPRICLGCGLGTSWPDNHEKTFHKAQKQKYKELGA